MEQKQQMKADLSGKKKSVWKRIHPAKDISLNRRKLCIMEEKLSAES